MRKIYTIGLALITLINNYVTAQNADLCEIVKTTFECNSSGCFKLAINPLIEVNETDTYAVSQIPFSPYPVGGTPVLIGIDDTYGPVVNIGFCFSFFGNTYTQCLITSNGTISFNLAETGNYHSWSISQSVPSTSSSMSDALNSILGPYHDMDPSLGGTITYTVIGTSPCRKFIATWNSIPMFGSGCTSTPDAKQQVVLHEGTNIIDMFIWNKSACTSWNSGYAIQGIQNSLGTKAFVVPGRNYPTVWSAANDGQRFAPKGTPAAMKSWLNSDSLSNTNIDSVLYCNLTQDINVTANVKFTGIGCTPILLTQTLTLNSAIVPKIDFDYSILENNEVAFTDLSSNLNGLAWYFGTGDSLFTVPGANPNYTYPDPGTYYATLVGCNNTFGCCSITKEIIFEKLLIPNVFTPNKDGVNDLLTITAIGYSNYHLKIFNRWGVLVFESNDNKKHWDGTINGNNASDGTYYYQLLVYSELKKEDLEYKGFVSLIR
ncbi:MAG: gliding motility-associated C-terminal domain-containing protein [Bacteroidetes bacterium]|nr:gliding motility-associated C-terminal domain-containing protein [Bacteroidota bacterium]